MSTNSYPQPLILFDGVCNLCQSSVQFILERDPQQQFKFASLQSETGTRIKAEYQVPRDTDSILLLDGNVLYSRSTAALRIARRLRAPWSWWYAAILLPSFLRDPVYNFIARNRYRWFGKQEACWLPTPELKARFLP